MDMARRLVSDPDYFETELLFLDEFGIVRRHPDFPQLLDDLGLTAYWASVGCAWRNDRVECGAG